ncbi:DUF559 domain-containing protein [Klenkia taihuensis]|uniref:Restriction endonuclease type II-like domain-containing protein n=1 Tax=Klenkia taihuensis TaxID=1225127 RepID=A0A1I1GJC6_9ACTN|nr:DUF559 domain-containing protein [Klenkia taihuensis]GHE09731.1 hypothetical protein GCM10011381_15860 [Klenkia taihuensis]SFC11372.1 Protein of unknown function [Klenkia taihuensis]
MAIDLVELLGADGARRSADVVEVVGPASVTRWVRHGRLLRPLPGVLVLPSRAGTWRTRAAAATLWTGGRLCGRSALYLSDLVADPGPLVHVAVGPARHVAVARPDWLRVHVGPAPSGPVAQGLPITADVDSLLTAWGHAHARRGTPREVEVARGAVIGACRRKRVAVDHLQEELAARSRLPARRALGHLLEQIARGCQSEFEIWGLTELLDVPGLPPVQLQYALQTAIGTVHLDAVIEEVQLGIELDGAAYHRSPDNWARDRRRDSAVLARGWVTLRIDHARAHRDPPATQEEITRAHWARKATLIARPPQQRAVDGRSSIILPPK